MNSVETVLTMALGGKDEAYDILRDRLLFINNELHKASIEVDCGELPQIEVLDYPREKLELLKYLFNEYGTEF